MNGINFVAPLRNDDEHSQAARNLLAVLEAAAIPCEVFDWDNPSYQENKLRRQGYSERIRYTTTLYFNNLPEIFNFRNRYPTFSRKTKTNIAYIRWENHEPPTDWNLGFNGIDRLWTTSEYTAQIFRKIYYPPVLVMPPVVLKPNPPDGSISSIIVESDTTAAASTAMLNTACFNASISWAVAPAVYLPILIGTEYSSLNVIHALIS